MPPGDADRLRAALRLLFESEDADRIAALATGARSRDEALRRVVGSSLLRRGLARWRGVLAQRRDSAPGCPPLGAQAALPARAALALALHLGLDLDGPERISTVDGRTERVPIESDWPAGSPLGEARPVALWLDRGTLLYAAPEDWEAGLPRRVTFWRVAVAADGQLADEAAMTIDARGREAGIHLRELALSPDGTRLAYRLRHYTRSDPASGAFDTLVVVPVADASRQLEIARGKPGDGLDWSPDSRWLVAGLRGRVELLSADGRQRAPLSPEGVTASYPVWVDPHTVWYQQVDGDEEAVMAVEVW